MIAVLVGGCAGLAEVSPTAGTQGWTQTRPAPVEGTSPRHRVGAVWTGEQVVVWGGSTNVNGHCDHGPYDDGAAWDPATGGWDPLPAAPLSARTDAQLSWSGSEVLVVGGETMTATDPCHPRPVLDAAAYGPVPDAEGAWRVLPPVPLPAGDGVTASGWDGSQLLVLGSSGGMRALDPTDDTWRELPDIPAPPSANLGAGGALLGAQALWTGEEWLVWATVLPAPEAWEESLEIGAALDPTTGSWRSVSTTAAPSFDEPLFWTGEVAIAFDLRANTLQMYDPESDEWRTGAESPLERLHAGEAATGVWTGDQLVLWGGSRLRDVQMCADTMGMSESEIERRCNPAPGPLTLAYTPTTDEWTTLPDGPWGRRSGSAGIWTGEEMLLLGGTDLDQLRTGQALPQDQPPLSAVTFDPPAP